MIWSIVKGDANPFLFDPSTTKNLISIGKDGGLAGADGADWGVGGNLGPAIVSNFNAGWDWDVARANLHQASLWYRACPDQVADLKGVGIEVRFLGGDYDGVVFGAEFLDPAAQVGANAQALALADGAAVAALVPGQDFSVRVDEFAAFLRGADQTAEVFCKGGAITDEAGVLAVWGLGGGKTKLFCKDSDLGFGHSSQRKKNGTKLLPR